MLKPRVEPTNDGCGAERASVCDKISTVVAVFAKMQPKIATTTTQLGATVSWKIKRKRFQKMSMRFISTRNVGWCSADETTVLHFTFPFLSSSFEFLKEEKIIVIISYASSSSTSSKCPRFHGENWQEKHTFRLLFFCRNSIVPFRCNAPFVTGIGRYHHLFYYGDYAP